MKEKILKFESDNAEFYVTAGDVMAIERMENKVFVRYIRDGYISVKEFVFHSDYSSYKLAQSKASKWVKMWQKEILENEKKPENDD